MHIRMKMTSQKVDAKKVTAKVRGPTIGELKRDLLFCGIDRIEMGRPSPWNNIHRIEGGLYLPHPAAADRQLRGARATPKPSYPTPTLNPTTHNHHELRSRMHNAGLQRPTKCAR